MESFRVVISYMFYYVGDFTYKICDKLRLFDDKNIGWTLFKFYQWCMGISLEIQGTGNGPWV